MTHYVCTGGCAGVTDKEGTCAAPTCSLYKQNLTACDCQDPDHCEKLEHKQDDEQ